ncbi:MAG: sodium-dependent transporter [Bifidobacteriaceae bacterium]|jgi:NSS family neurotransmitter:Na+ symporter|nr:sodium-dependent transporter [Bifidobacteriaceae bacterium]
MTNRQPAAGGGRPGHPGRRGHPGQRQQWSGQWGFIISAIGSAVGLGNIWRFPGVAYDNGGGAFLIPSLVALLTAGIPILFLDYALGHRYRGSAPLAFRRLGGRFGRWVESVGWFQVMICFFIAVYYAAILAWAASYFVFSFDQRWGEDTVGFLVGQYLQTDGVTGGFLAPVAGVMAPLALIWAVAIAVMAAGVKRGVERANTIAIPVLVIAFGVLVVRSLFLPGAADGLNSLFTPDFAALTDLSVWVAAYAQIFFSLSIAFGIMLTYASYRKRRSNLTSPGLVVAFANSSFEIMAGLGVFSILGFMARQNGQTMAELAESTEITGVGLSFMTFPKVVSEMPGAAVFGALFFGSLLLAGFTSLISILQVISGALQDKFNLSEPKAALVMGLPVALISLAAFGTKAGLANLDVVDKYTNEVGIVLSAVVMMVVVMWVYRRGREFSHHLTALSTFPVGPVWRFLVGLVAPLVLGYILVMTVLGLLGEPYGGYDRWLVNLGGWGVVGLGAAVALVLPLVAWPRDPLDFQAYPAYGSEVGAADRPPLDDADRAASARGPVGGRPRREDLDESISKGAQP